MCCVERQPVPALLVSSGVRKGVSPSKYPLDTRSRSAAEWCDSRPPRLRVPGRWLLCCPPAALRASAALRAALSCALTRASSRSNWVTRSAPTYSTNYSPQKNPRRRSAALRPRSRASPSASPTRPRTLCVRPTVGPRLTDTGTPERPRRGSLETPEVSRPGGVPHSPFAALISTRACPWRQPTARMRVIVVLGPFRAVRVRRAAGGGQSPQRRGGAPRAPAAAPARRRRAPPRSGSRC